MGGGCGHLHTHKVKKTQTNKKIKTKQANFRKVWSGDQQHCRITSYFSSHITLLKGDFPHHCRNGAGNELCDNPKLTVETPWQYCSETALPFEMRQRKRVPNPVFPSKSTCIPNFQTKQTVWENNPQAIPKHSKQIRLLNFTLSFWRAQCSCLRLAGLIFPSHYFLARCAKFALAYWKLKAGTEVLL